MILRDTEIYNYNKNYNSLLQLKAIFHILNLLLKMSQSQNISKKMSLIRFFAFYLTRDWHELGKLRFMQVHAYTQIMSWFMVWTPPNLHTVLGL